MEARNTKELKSKRRNAIWCQPRTLVIACHEKQRNRYMDDLALQVSNAVMAASDPGESLTKFIRNIEARVFADMQSAPPQEMNENYGLPAGGRPDM